MKKVHQCSHCHKPEGEVGFSRNGNRLYFICKPCNNVYRKRFKLNPELKKIRENRLAEKCKRDRAYGVDREKYILWESRRWDRDRGLDNNLTREYIKQVIGVPCTYCGETKLQMTLDRIDNNKGHTTENVVGSCVRCNFLRRDMPHEAWVVLAKTVKEINRQGLFGSWTGEVHRKK